MRGTLFFWSCMYYYDKLNLRFSIKRVRYHNATKESVSILVDIARYLFSFVNSKTSSRARDRKGVDTQKSKMAAQNGVPNNEFQPLSFSETSDQIAVIL